MPRRQTLVTWGKWGVSTCHPPMKGGTGYELSVFYFHNGKLVKGTGYGRIFPTQEAADQFALEHGFLQPYYRKWGFVSLTNRWCYLGRLGRGPWPHLKKEWEDLTARLTKRLVDTELLKDNGCEPRPSR